MKFMFIVKSTHSGAPTPALLEAMHKLANREIKAGRMLDNGGLGSSAFWMVRSSKPRKSSAVTQYSSCTARTRPWPRRSSSCSFTKIFFRAGKERANSARLPRGVLESRIG